MWSRLKSTTPKNSEKKIVWKLKRALYGLKTAPKQWQDYFADVLGELGGERLRSEPNVYYFAAEKNYVLVYVDDLVVLGTTPKPLFDKIQAKVLLKYTGALVEGATMSFLGLSLIHI